MACLAGTATARGEGPGDDGRRALWSADWSADGARLAVGGAWAGVFEAATLSRLPTPALEGRKAVARVAWQPGGGRLLALSGGGDGGVTGVYDPAADRLTVFPEAEEDGEGGTRGIAWSPDGKRLATAGNRGALRIHSVDGAPLHTPRPQNTRSLTGVAWNPRRDIIVTVGEFITWYDGEGHILKQVSHRPEAKGHCLLLCAEWHPSGEFLVVGDYGNAAAGEPPALQFWSADYARTRVMIMENGGPVRSARWNREGTLLASASDALRVWAKDGDPRPLHAGPSPEPLWGVAWNPAGDRILTTSHGGRVTLWSASAERVRHIREPSPAPSPTGPEKK